MLAVDVIQTVAVVPAAKDTLKAKALYVTWAVLRRVRTTA
jgi:hypothetical protein